MAYKTNDVAKKLGVNVKIILKYAKQENILKNELGHYIFSEDDIRAIKVYLSTPHKNSPSIPIELIESLQHQIQALTKRTEENEGKLSRKADEGVSYQLLHHRKEIEELRNMVAKMDIRLRDLEENVTRYQDMNRLQEIKKPRRKGVLMNILGL
jgi:chromosome-anchoring protein RacA